MKRPRRPRLKRSRQKRFRRPQLTIEQVLAWADAHCARTGDWPNSRSGPVFGVPGESWGNINSALHDGFRGLPGGDSLARVLEKHRGVCKRPPRKG